MSIEAEASEAPGTPPMVFRIEAHTAGPGRGHIHAPGPPIEFDAAPRPGGERPGPAELLAGAFAACMLKNVGRFSEILGFRQTGASVRVEIARQDSPPKFTRIGYELRVRTDEDPARVDLLHRNLRRDGTVYNTLAAVCEVEGTIVAEAPGTGA